MAETLLSFEVEKLRNLLFRESERFQGVEEQFNGLKIDLNMLRCFLEDADAKKHKSARVRTIVEDIKEIVLDAEDIIETFLLKEELGIPSIRESVRKLACITVKRKGLASDIRAISKRIYRVIHYMQSFGVQQIIVNDLYTQSLQEGQMIMPQEFTRNTEEHLVGLEENVEKLVGYLVEEGTTSQVVSIIGMGGIGKTTLARLVFNHETVKSYFKGLAWVCVSQPFKREYVWRTILRQLRPRCEVSKMAEEELQEKIHRVLEEQKALIVLDDIWSEEDWVLLNLMLPRAKGWKILLTSRNEGVALRADPTCFTFKPNCLSLEESWTLFRRTAFPNSTENKVDEEMEEMGKQMIKHCGGLPLAVKVLGGLLAAQYTLREWARVYENIKPHIVGGTSFNDRNINSVYHILYLSYEELPIYLKHCFLYLAHFPEDYAIEVEKLSYYWAAEGIPRPEYYERASFRDVADGYMEELVKRNMVVSERDIRTSRYETCQLHDMMREVCLRQVKEENFLQIAHDSSTAASSLHYKFRRLVIQSHGDTYLMERLQNPKLRTLLLIKQSPLLKWMAQDLLFTSLQLIRVLDLSESDFGGKLPSDIDELIHLRYLSLYKAHVTHLPSSMGKLKRLIYLNLCVAAGSPIYMSNFLKELRELRYLSFPWEIQDEAKLELGNLTNLEKLENFSTKHSNVCDLHHMKRLRTLSILLNGQGCSMETLSSCLGEMQHLENLTISDHGDDKKKYFLGCIPSVQVEQAVPSHLTTISLCHCYLKEDPMPVLEKLLLLKEVYLGERSFSGKKMVCSGGGFPQLQKLTLKKLVQLEEWVVEEGSMILLQTLSIRFCDKLKELSDGLRFIPMKELTVVVSEKPFKEKLSRGGEDYYKVQHIPVLKIYGYLRK